MLTFRLMGCVAVLLCGTVYPRLCARDRRQALLQADALAALVRFICEQIEYYRMPLDAILLRCDADILCHLGKGSTLTRMFDATPWLDGELEEIALELSRELGRGYFSEQLSICRRALERIGVWQKKHADAEVKKAKTQGVLSIGAAVLAIILFI